MLLQLTDEKTIMQIDELIDSFLPTNERYTLAARITGPAKSAFPNGAPPEATAPPATPAKATRPTISRRPRMAALPSPWRSRASRRACCRCRR